MSTFIWNLPPAAPVAPASTPPGGATDSISIGLSRLCQEFKDRPNIIANLTAWLTPFIDLDQAISDVLTKRSIDTATGVQLDKLGSIVGAKRAGLDDESYRRRLFAFIATNRSGGSPAEIVNICRLIINDPAVRVQYLNQGVATFVVRAEAAIDDSVARDVTEFAQDASVAGVRVIFEYLYDELENTIKLPYTTFMTANIIAGGTILHVGTTAGFPDSGAVDIARGDPSQRLAVPFIAKTSSTITLASAIGGSGFPSGTMVQTIPAGTFLGLRSTSGGSSTCTLGHAIDAPRF